jgi:hypothetical protein
MSFEKLSTFRTSGMALVMVILALCCAISVVSAADASYEGYLGDTIALQGESYSGNQVYMFMTGPGLPENGVTLTDVTQRADQGQFTIVPLDNTQHYLFKWNTQRIHTEIDPGTYTVYVVNEPVDKAHLIPGSYQTLSVYLKKDTSISQVSINVGASYTLNPEMHSSTIISTPVPVNTTTISTTTVATLPPVQNPTSTTTTRAAAQPITTAIAVICIIGILLYRRHHT